MAIIRRQFIIFLRGKRAPKNAIFCSKIFQKCLKTPVLFCFFSKICLRRKKILSKWGLCSSFGELRKSVWLTQNISRQNFQNIFEIFENPPPPPSKNPKPAPARATIYQISFSWLRKYHSFPA